MNEHIEFREGAGDDPIAAAVAAVEEMRSATTEFQTRQTNELRTITDRLTSLETRMNRPTGGNPTNPETDLKRRAFFNYVRRGREALDLDEVRALTVGDSATAGYLAPEAYGSEILRALTEFSPIRAYARVTSIGATSIKYPKRLFGPTATWVDEDDDSPETGPTYGQVTLTPGTMRTFVDVSNSLLEDNAYNLEGELGADLAEAFGVEEGSAFVTGTGVGRPKGLLTAAGIAELKTGAAATLGTNPADTIIAMFHALPSAHAQRGCWLMNRTTLSALRQIKDANSRYLLVDPVAASAPTTLLGRPIVEALDMPDVAANAYPILFGDLQGYRIVDRVGFSLFRDPYTQRGKDRTRLHARRRVGGDVTPPDRFVKLKVSA